MARDEKQPGVMFYSEWLDMMQEMTIEQAGEMAIAALKYGLYGTEPDFGKDKALRMCWKLIAQRIKRDNERYMQRCEENQKRARYGAYKKQATENGQNILPFDEWCERVGM